jgi:hypothetical protein
MVAERGGPRPSLRRRDSATEPSPGEACYADWIAMPSSPSNVDLGPTTETVARGREVQLIINIAEPDPEFQPYALTDEASLLDVVPTPAVEITRRLDAYFRGDLELNLALPLWRLVDVIKRLRPGWPDALEPN